jgi:hypothetical protein
MEARLPHTGKPELERWITTTADSLEQAKADLAEIERLLEEAKAKVRSGDYSGGPQQQFSQAVGPALSGSMAGEMLPKRKATHSGYEVAVRGPIGWKA